jgi:prepilin-type processing-associated H-X9-DG protein
MDGLLCPSDEPAASGGVDPGQTNYCFSAGDAVTSTGPSLPLVNNASGKNPRGPFGHNSRIRSADFLDGASNTLAMSERVRAFDSFSLKGGVVEISGIENDPSLCAAAEQPGGVLAGGTTYAWSGLRWQDGAPGFMAVTTILSPNSPCCVSPSSGGGASPQNMGIYSPSSYHPGGVAALFCDGSARLVAEEIDTGDITAPEPVRLGDSSPYGVWGALGSRRGREIIDAY